MNNSIHIMQTAHFRAQFRFAGYSKRKAVEIEHHPQLDPSRTWRMKCARGRSALARCQVDIWTVFGEHTALGFSYAFEPDGSDKRLVKVTADKNGLKIFGVESTP